MRSPGTSLVTSSRPSSYPELYSHPPADPCPSQTQHGAREGTGWCASSPENVLDNAHLSQIKPRAFVLWNRGRRVAGVQVRGIRTEKAKRGSARRTGQQRGRRERAQWGGEQEGTWRMLTVPAAEEARAIARRRREREEGDRARKTDRSQGESREQSSERRRINGLSRP